MQRAAMLINVFERLLQTINISVSLGRLLKLLCNVYISLLWKRINKIIKCDVREEMKEGGKNYIC